MRLTRFNPYLEAAKQIPKGETRSFMELAAMAGRPGAARVAGRAMGQCGRRSIEPWHRIVASNGALAKNAARAAEQLRRLRREGARPRRGESVADWARRVGRPWVGNYAGRRFASASDRRLVTVSPERAEGFPSEAVALARRFVHLDGAAPVPESLPDPLLRKAAYRSPDAALLAQRLLSRVARLDWIAVGDSLTSSGYFHIEAFLSSSDCSVILEAASDATRFERSVNMAPKGYGVGTYYYFREPLMEPAAAFRAALYQRLQPLANEPGVGTKDPYPPTLDEFWRRCREADQKRGSSIILCYGAGGLNHPHRDIYGKVFFPYQVLVVLNEQGRDFEGGEFVLLEETPKGGAQEVVVNRGDVVIFATRDRFETEGGRRRKVELRHGMRLVTRGKRYALGIVFHLAE